MMTMTKMNVRELENVNGGTRREIIELKNALGVEGDDDNKQILEAEDLLFHKYKIYGLLYNNSSTPNVYRNVDTGEYLTHSQVMTIIS